MRDGALGIQTERLRKVRDRNAVNRASKQKGYIKFTQEFFLYIIKNMITKISINDSKTKNIQFTSIWNSGAKPKTVAVINRDIKEQIESLISAVFDVFKAYKKHSVQKDDVLTDLFKNIHEQFGIKKISENLMDGIVFDGKDKNYIFSIHGEHGLRVREQNKDTNVIEKSVFIHENKIVKTDTKNIVPDKVEYFQYNGNVREQENYLKEIFDDIDFRLLKIKRKLLEPEIQSRLSKSDYPIYYMPIVKIKDVSKAGKTVPVNEKPKPASEVKKNYNPTNNKKPVRSISPAKKSRKPLPALEIEGIKSAKRKKRKLKFIEKREITAQKAVPKISLLKRKGMLSENDMLLAKEISDLFNKIHNMLKTVNNSLTRSKIKNGYPPLGMGKSGSKILEFESVGQKREDISVNILNDHYIKHLVINVTEFDGKTKNIIVNSKGEVLKKPSSVLEREWYNDGKKNTNQFYTQDEVNNLNFSQYFIVLKKQLSSYNSFINGKIDALNDKKVKYTTFEEGSVAQYDKLLKSVQKQYSNYKTNIVSVFNINERHAIKKQFNIHTQQGHPSIIFRKITPNGGDLHLSYPKINGEICTKILVLDKDGAIKNTLFVKDNKLVKYDANDIHSRKHNDRKFYYYSQQEIDESGLQEYLKIIEKHLKTVNKTIDNVKNF